MARWVLKEDNSTGAQGLNRNYHSRKKSTKAFTVRPTKKLCDLVPCHGEKKFASVAVSKLRLINKNAECSKNGNRNEI